MATYIVGHRLRKKKVEIEISENEEWKIHRKTSGFLMSILREYLNKTKYSPAIRLHYLDLTFERKSPKPPKPYFSKTFVRDSAGEPCDKDWCNYCRKGDYEKCPYRR